MDERGKKTRGVYNSKSTEASFQAVKWIAVSRSLNSLRVNKLNSINTIIPLKLLARITE